MNPATNHEDGRGPVEHRSIVRRRFWYAMLAMMLAVPFVLREVSPQLEAYPALLFPTGAFTAQVGDSTVAYPAIEVLAVMPDSSEHAINARAFMGRIPVQYFLKLSDRHFGLEPLPYVTHWSNLLGRDRHWSPKERKRTMQWLAWRAKETGNGGAVALRFRRSVKTVNTRTGKMIGSKVKYSYEMPIGHE
jgi:hypothetical protein